MSLLELEFAREAHPVDVIEQVAHSNDWTFERTGDDEIAISVAGNWTDYHISFSWMEDFEALHLACAFDIKVAEPRVNEVMRLLSLINEKLLMGHFDLWQQEGAIMYRQSLLLAGGAEPTSRQVEVLLSAACARPSIFRLSTTVAFFVMPGCKERFVCVPVLTYLQVRSAPVLENHSFRHGLTNLQL